MSLTENDLENIANKQTLLLDVRSPEEFQKEKALYAQNLNAHDILEGAVPDVPNDTPIKVYCSAGGRAGRAKNALIRAGFSDVENIGGFKDLPEKLKQ